VTNHMMTNDFVNRVSGVGLANDLLPVRMQLFTMLTNLEDYFAPQIADAAIRDLGQRYRFPYCPGFSTDDAVDFMSTGRLLMTTMEHPIMGGGRDSVGNSILAVNSSLPLSVWPLVLEKAGSTNYITHSSENNDRKFDAVHHLLQNAVTMQSWLREKRCKVVVGIASSSSSAAAGADESIPPTVEAIASSSWSNAATTTACADFKCCVIM